MHIFLRREFDAGGFPSHDDGDSMSDEGFIELERLLQLGEPLTAEEYRSEVRIAVANLRVPLTGMMGYLALLAGSDFGTLPRKQKNLMGELLAENQRVLRLVNQFIEVGRISSHG